MDNILNLLYINIPCWIALIILIVRICKATKRGLVQEICNLIATIAGCFVILVITFAVRNYINQEKVIFVITIFLLAIFGLVYKLFSGLLEAIKLVSKLPVVKTVDKVLGVVLGICETIVIVWMVYCIILIMNAGPIEESVLNCVRENTVMRFFFEHNLIYTFIAPFSETLANIDFVNLIKL